MDIRAALLEEHSRSQTDKIIRFIGTDIVKLDLLVQLFLQDSYRVVQRASWPLSEICLKWPEITVPYLPLFLEQLQQPGIHVGVKRNIMRIFQVGDLPIAIHESLLHLAFGYLTDRTEAIAVRALSMTVLRRIAPSYPDIIHELELVLGDILLYEQSAGLLSRARKELKQLQKLR